MRLTSESLPTLWLDMESVFTFTLRIVPENHAPEKGCPFVIVYFNVVEAAGSACVYVCGLRQGAHQKHNSSQANNHLTETTE